jgi:hypothetical protein
MVDPRMLFDAGLFHDLAEHLRLIESYLPY